MASLKIVIVFFLCTYDGYFLYVFVVVVVIFCCFREGFVVVVVFGGLFCFVHFDIL